ncbi:hypothetical protein FJU08_12905 [Martelella alba]|uniref:Uncharacterized protein n=1 Tax=Martelella alba TaxID=2590451 RepID=A0A506UAT6_9HYPH|nr:hypothetical protein [Martelella alba]TPW29709.1 hypothetical protein FJU08_12905 [Martelella alba]
MTTQNQQAPSRLFQMCSCTTEPATGFVEVLNEPRHFHRFQNDYVRVYDVRFGPGETSLYHRHNIDTMYVTVNDAEVYDHTFQSDETTAKTHHLTAGLSMCRPHGSDPLIHKVRNDGDGLMHMIGAEVLKLPDLVSEKPLSAPCHTQLDNLSGAERLRFYRIALQPGETTGEITYGFSGLTVSISDASVAVAEPGGSSRVLSFSPGSHVWHDGPVTQMLTNVGETEFVAILGEWC